MVSYPDSSFNLTDMVGAQPPGCTLHSLYSPCCHVWWTSKYQESVLKDVMHIMMQHVLIRLDFIFKIIHWYFRAEPQSDVQFFIS